MQLALQFSRATTTQSLPHHHSSKINSNGSIAKQLSHSQHLNEQTLTLSPVQGPVVRITKTDSGHFKFQSQCNDEEFLLFDTYILLKHAATLFCIPRDPERFGYWLHREPKFDAIPSTNLRLDSNPLFCLAGFSECLIYNPCCGSMLSNFNRIEMETELQVV